MRTILFTTALIVFLASAALADTTVSGNIQTDTTWTLVGSPYIVNSTVYVYGTTTTPVTLTIEPGVVVKFGASGSLQIGYSTNKGALVAQGTSSNRITFTRSGTSGNWGGISFQDGTVDETTIIENADISYGSTMYFYSASPVIRNATITNVNGFGMNMSSSNPTLDNVTVSCNGTYGIYLASSNPIITGGSLNNTNTSGYGIYGSGSPVISNYNVAIVDAAGKYGLYLTSATSNLSVTNSTIGNGIFLYNTSFIPTISGNTFTNSDNSPPHAGANIIGQIIGSNTFSGMTSAGRIEVAPEQISRDAFWKKNPAPYVVSSTLYVYKDLTAPATLTVEAGATVQFSSNAGLRVGYSNFKGALVAQGTTANRITFTRSGTSGNWGGINFQGSGTGDATTVIENADIRYSNTMSFSSVSPVLKNTTITEVNGNGLSISYSNPTLENITINCNGTYGMYLTASNPIITGGSLTNVNAAGFGIYGNGSPVISNYNVAIVNTAGMYGIYLSYTTSALSVINSTIGNGIYLYNTAITPTITENTFSNSDSSPPHAGANIIGQILNDNTFTGMTAAGRIEVVGEQINRDSLWKKYQAPFAILSTVTVYKDATTTATLTIEPGVKLLFASNAYLSIGYSNNKGALKAQGTSAERIIFTRNGTSGTWGGISFQVGSANTSTVIENADIQFSTGLYIYNSSPLIKNTTITDVAGNGITLSYSNPTFDNVTINCNGSYGISLTSSNPVISGGSLTNTNSSGFGIYGGGSPVISNYNVSIVNSAGKYGLYLPSSTTALSVTNSTIGNGLFIGSTGINPTITGNTFTNLDSSPVHIEASLLGRLLTNNTLTGLSAAGKIELTGGQISEDTLWKNLQAPYVILGYIYVYKNTVSPATLTIEPGTVVKFESGINLQIGYGNNKGSLVAQGTSDNRIKFTRNSSSGTWGGIIFNDGTVDSTAILENVDVQFCQGISMTAASPVIRNTGITDVTGIGLTLSNANPILDNVTISNNGTYGINLASSSPVITGGSVTNESITGYGIYGGGSPIISNYTVSIPNTPGKYGVYLSGATSNLKITDSTISNGIYIADLGIAPNITNNTFSNFDNSPLHAGANIIGQILANNTFNGMTNNGRIEVVGEQITQDSLWKKYVAPYKISSTVNVYKALTVEAGTTLRFGSGTGLVVGSGSPGGILVANGTSASPIVFTSDQASPSAGYWQGVTIAGENAATSVLSNVVIEYGGYGGQYANANLSLVSTSPLIRNVSLRNSSGSGIYVGSATNLPRIVDSTITSNKWGVYSQGSNPIIYNNRIYGNSTAGVWNASSYTTVDARNNWWGNVTGPNHANNTAGTGDKVSDYVLYNPWIGQTPASALSFCNVTIAPTTFNPEGDSVTFSLSISASANWTITIYDSTNAVVKSFSGSGTTIMQQWAGENAQSVKVPDGNYTYKIEATNPSTSETASPLTGSLKVNRQFPIATITAPSDNQILAGGAVLDVIGTAADSTDFKTYTLEYGTGDNPVSWIALKYSNTQANNSLMYSWNLSNATGGVYTLRLTVTDNAGNTATKTVRVRLLWIQNALLSESFISPNGDLTKDTTMISASASYPVNWSLTISNASDTTVRTLSGNGGIFAATWDGRNGAGAVVPDGVYNYRIDAIDPVSSTQAAPKTGSVTVDATLPSASIITPASGSTLTGVVHILGVASDSNMDNYKVEYGPSSGAGPWTSISSSTTPVTAGTLATWTTNDEGGTIPVANGTYVLKLTVADKAGNISTASMPVIVDNLFLSNISASSQVLDTSLGQTASISFTVNKAATVNMKIIPEKLGANGAPLYQATSNCAEAGSYSFTWNGRSSAGTIVPDEAYLYVLEATDGTKSDSYSPTAPASVGSTSISCSPSSGFDPEKNLPMIVTYSITQPSRVNIYIKYYKVVDAFAVMPGSHTYDWDGRTLDNKLLDRTVQPACFITELLPENIILATGDHVRVSSLKTDPYALHLSYGQPTKITYDLERDAIVTVKLVSPSGATQILISNESQTAGNHEISWNGIDIIDTSGKKIMITESGDYMVSVVSANLVTGTITTRRGNLKVDY